ncbi:AI-2E family transporter [Desulfobaculum senezii]|jgi:predicted PurR-regulated permease PerM|uniref:AI-2E family transporter n=1 Tax=Desulfobaculum sp. SPO524 TaxID=3378071 RepID=UPI003852E621
MTQDSRPGISWPAPRGSRYYSLFLFTLILFALYLAYRVFSPFLHPIIFSGVLAAICTPMFTRISSRLGGHENVAAGIVVLLVTVCVFIPAFFFLTGLATQGAQSIAAVTDWIRHTDFDALLGQSRFDAVSAWLSDKLPYIHLEDIDIQSGLLRFSRQVGETSIQLGTGLLTDAFSVLLDFFIMLFILFFLLRDGRRIVATVKYLSPLREEQEDSIIYSLRRVSRSVLVGGLLVAMLQGLAGGVGLAAVDIPALFWGTMMGFSSLIPVLGTGLVWVPASGYLLIVGKWKAAVFLMLWCGLLVTSIDTFLRPYFMRGASGMPLIYIFLSVIGGLQAFGPPGLLYGPLILSFAMVMLRIYGEEYRDVLMEKEFIGPKPEDSTTTHDD